MQSSGGESSRKPYSWQSEEFQISDRTQNYQAKQTQVFTPSQPNYQRHSPQMVQPLQPAAPLYGQPHGQQQQHPQYYAYGHHYCPNCRTQVIPGFKRKISQAGWIVFAVLLVSIPPLFWIGLCIREDCKICSICKTQIT